MSSNQDPQFESIEQMWNHYRGLIDLQAVEVTARAIAELEGEGVTVSADMKEQLVQRIRQLLSDSLDESESSMNQRLLKGN